MFSDPTQKYSAFPSVPLFDRRWPCQTITNAPVWCSVDLRDGNQALPIPMNISQKLEMFQALVRCGFKEIEVGFPSASNTEFEFNRRLIEENRIPDDVAIQVLVQAREDLIERTIESLRVAKNVIIHLYNSTSPAQRRVVFNMSKGEIIKVAIRGATWIQERLPELKSANVRLQYSPESFSATEVEFAKEICEAVIDVWKPSPDRKIIVNLPDTVEVAMPNVYADQIEGTLFGNGERTGNLDIVAVALNLYAHGVDPKLDFSNINRLRDIYERCTGMLVPSRQPYAGELVFTAFSGSHQDAIKKGLHEWANNGGTQRWDVPYLTIDPADIGREYREVIRVNSQSGKGGIAYLLENEFGIELPKDMQREFGPVANDEVDRLGREVTAGELKDMFWREYILHDSPWKLIHFHLDGDTGRFSCSASVLRHLKRLELSGQGNGPIAAFVDALESTGEPPFQVSDYREHALSSGSDAQAIAYIRVIKGGATSWGAGVDTNIELASIRAVLSALNRLEC